MGNKYTCNICGAEFTSFFAAALCCVEISEDCCISEIVIPTEDKPSIMPNTRLKTKINIRRKGLFDE